MNHEYSFDVNAIIAIRYIKEYQVEYDWYEAQPIKKWKWFRFIDTGKFTPAGFGQSRHTDDQMTGYGYNVNSQHQVFRQPTVTIELPFKKEHTMRFSNNEDAEKWIANLKKASGKTFETTT